MSKHFTHKIAAGAATAVIAASLVATGGGAAFADSTAFGTSDQTAEKAVTNLLTTYGVRAGSAGGDYLGISNTNYDFTAGSAKLNTEYTGYGDKAVTDDSYLGISIWGTSVNENPNPYYWNLIYNRMSSGVATQATTWMSNPEDNSWGDSNGVTNTATQTKAGMEFGGPDIVFGASKTANWENGDQSETNFYSYDQASSDWNPTYVNNDATNIWTQIYTEGKLAAAADGLSKSTRYNNGSATESALSYEKAIRGNLLYVASKIDANSSVKKKVAYLYAIDSSGAAYFFTPQAKGLLKGDDTGAGVEGNSNYSTEASPDDNYAANNSTINMGYMATLPFITTTFDGKDASGNYKNGCSEDSVTMKVEDIYKSSPLIKVTDATALSGVDVIIYNTNKDLTSTGTSGGKNSTGILNKEMLTNAAVTTWLGSKASVKTILAGDDYGTSTKQGDQDDQAPLLYCQRNYTMDKNARAAWAFAKVYPELYGSNDNATYGYWVNKVYHVKTASVSAVVAKMTNQKTAEVTYTASTASDIEKYAEAGYQWWVNTGVKDAAWKDYAYYTGSSRASYYSTSANNEENGKIGIFEPSDSWKAEAHVSVAPEATSQQVLMSVNTAAPSPSLSLSVADAETVTPTYDGNYPFAFGSFVPASYEKLDDGTWKMNLKVADKTLLDASDITKTDLYTWQCTNAGVSRYNDHVSNTTNGEVSGSQISVIEVCDPIKSVASETVSVLAMDSYNANLKKIIFPEDISIVSGTLLSFVRIPAGSTGPEIVFSGTEGENVTSKLRYIGSNAIKATEKTAGSEYSLPNIKVPADTIVADDAFTLGGSADKAWKVERVGLTAVEKAIAKQKAADEKAQLEAIQKLYPNATSLDDLVASAKADQQKADKASNPTLTAQKLTVTTSKSYKAKKLKKKAQSFKVASAKGKVTVKKIKGSKKLKVKNGKVTVKKGTKKGVYTIKVSVKAAATSAYAAANTTVTVTVVVK